MELNQHKSYLFNGMEELKKVSSFLQKNNSQISDRNKLLSFSKYPFMTGFSLSLEIKEKIRKKINDQTKDSGSLMLSLISVVDGVSNTRHHIVSVELINEEVIGFYVNYSFLSNYMRVPRISLNEVTRFSSIERVISNLTSELAKKNQSYSPSEVNDSVGLDTACERLKRTINAVYNGTFLSDSEFFLFTIDDVRFKFASDYMSVDNHYYSGSTLLYNFNRGVYERGSAINNQNPDVATIKNQKALTKYTHDAIFSQSQKNAFMQMNNAVNLVIGAGGSGKTYMAKIICEKSLELNAILHAQKSKVLAPMLYTTFSKGSLAQFLSYCKNGDNPKNSMIPLIFSRNEACVKNRLAILNESCDISRYSYIENKLANINLGSLTHNLQEETESYAKVSSFLEYVIMSRDLPSVEAYTKYIEENKKSVGFLEELLVKFGIKPEAEIKIPSDIMQGLYNTGKTFPSNVLNKNADKTLQNIKNVYMKNHDVAEQKFKELYSRINSVSRPITSFGGIDYENMDNLKPEDVLFYLKYYPLRQSVDKQDKYRELLIQIQTDIKEGRAINFYKNVRLKSGKTSCQPDLEKISLFCDLFPLSADIVTNITDLDIYFDKAIVDEAVLVPGIFTHMILGKTNSIIAMGDINQLELDLNLVGDLPSTLSTIHSTDPKPYCLTYSLGGDQISIFNHLKRSIDEETSLKILVDNYRCRKEIFELSQIIQNKYTEYIEKYKTLNNIEGGNFIKYFNNSAPIYSYKEVMSVNEAFVFVDSTPDRYQIIEGFIAENNIAPANVFIIVPFRNYINVVKSMLKNQEIIVDTLENIQGRDAEIVIYDSFLDSIIGDEYREITNQKFNLTITRAKNLFVFMGSEDVCFNQKLDDRNEEAADVIKKFFRNPQVQICKLNVK